MSEVFVSYGHPDDTMGWVQRFSADLGKHLEGLTREPPRIFSDHRINPLEFWREVIKEAAQAARVLVVISSPNFLSSDWCKTECKLYWQRESCEATRQNRIAVIELLPISDAEIERIVVQRKRNSLFIDPREVRQVLKNFTPIVFYKENRFGVPMPLALVLGEVDARNTPDYAEYAERVYTFAFFIKEAVDELRQSDEEERAGEDDDVDITLDDLEPSDGAAPRLGSVFIDCGPRSGGSFQNGFLSTLRSNPGIHFSVDFDGRDYDRLRAERFATDEILVALYEPGEDDWLRDTVEVVYRALKLRKDLGHTLPRKLLIAGELSPEMRTHVLRRFTSLIAFVDLEVVGLEQATAILSARATARAA